MGVDGILRLPYSGSDGAESMRDVGPTGGHIRVGLEDNLFFDPLERTQPATNAGLIDRAVKVARAVNRDVASPEEARQIIGIHPSQLSKS